MKKDDREYGIPAGKAGELSMWRIQLDGGYFKKGD